MSARRLGTQIAKIGVVLLVLWVPVVPWAQSADMERSIYSAQRAGSEQWLFYPSDSLIFSSGWNFAISGVPDESPNGQQQSLSPVNKQQLAPGYSIATAYRHPVPGSAPALQGGCVLGACSRAQEIMCCAPVVSPFTRYLKSPDAVNLTARDNLRSAVKNIIDPFNLLTIGADAAIGVASNSHSVYGPGATGIAKYAGVSLTEDMTGEFFGTFLIPSLLHQDPHYHREPFMPIKHRVLHAIAQVVWARSYTGQPMFNYANIFGGIATAAVSNTFVPGPGRQGFGATSERLAVAFAISPSGNLIEEFVPDIAQRINLRVVIFQRILNTVSLEESGVP